MQFASLSFVVFILSLAMPGLPGRPQVGLVDRWRNDINPAFPSLGVKGLVGRHDPAGLFAVDLFVGDCGGHIAALVAVKADRILFIPYSSLLFFWNAKASRTR